MLDTRVHGVVVQMSSEAPISASGPDVTGIRTYTDGLDTVSYPPGCPSSWSDRPVPQRGQYGVMRKSRNSRPLSNTCFSDHQTASTYSGSIVRYAWSVLTQ